MEKWKNSINQNLPIAVIGAGFCGISAALALTDHHETVHVFESAGSAGGLSCDDAYESFRIENIYHHIFTSDHAMIDMMKRFDQLPQIHWYKPKNAVFYGGTLYPFTTPKDLLSFRPMPFIARLRTGLTVILARVFNDPWKLDKITAKKWLQTFGGKKAYQVLWEPLLRSKFDLDADAISGTWIWNKFKLRGASRQKGLANESLGYPEGGFMPLLQAMIHKIVSSSGKIELNTRINKININDDGTFCLDDASTSSSLNQQRFKKVLFTGSSESFLSMLPFSISQKIISHQETAVPFGIEGIGYKANLCLQLTLSNSLSPWYWITVSDSALPFVVVVEHTQLTGKEPYGSHIVYLSRYLSANDPLYSKSDDEVIECFLQGLHSMFSEFERGSVLNLKLTRSRYAQPIVTVGSGSRRSPVKLPIEGLFLAGMAQIWPEDRGLNYAILQGINAAQVMIQCEEKVKN